VSFFCNFFKNCPQQTITQSAKIRPIWSPWLQSPTAVLMCIATVISTVPNLPNGPFSYYPALELVQRMYLEPLLPLQLPTKQLKEKVSAGLFL
jgi:hypothetical protein